MRRDKNLCSQRGADKLKVPLHMPTQKPDCLPLFVYVNQKAAINSASGTAKQQRKWRLAREIRGLVANLTNPIAFVPSSIWVPVEKKRSLLLYTKVNVRGVRVGTIGPEGTGTHHQGSVYTVSSKLSLSWTQRNIMTDAPVTFSQVEYNGDIPPESGKPPVTEASEAVSDVESTPPYYRVEPSLAGPLTEGNQEKSEKLQGKRMLNWSTDEKILKGKTFSFSSICLI